MIFHVVEFRTQTLNKSFHQLLFDIQFWTVQVPYTAGCFWDRVQTMQGKVRCAIFLWILEARVDPKAELEPAL